MLGKKELKPQEKLEVTTLAEQTKPGPSFTPNVDIFENEKEKIVAEVKNGVLRLTLPKVAKALPRKIMVQAA